jgi:hypothetical protein
VKDCSKYDTTGATPTDSWTLSILSASYLPTLEYRRVPHVIGFYYRCQSEHEGCLQCMLLRCEVGRYSTTKGFELGGQIRHVSPHLAIPVPPSPVTYSHVKTYLSQHFGCSRLCFTFKLCRYAWFILDKKT